MPSMHPAAARHTHVFVRHINKTGAHNLTVLQRPCVRVATVSDWMITKHILLSVLPLPTAVNVLYQNSAVSYTSGLVLDTVLLSHY